MPTLDRLLFSKAVHSVALISLVACLGKLSIAQTADTSQSISGWTLTGQMNVPRARHTATLLKNGTVLVVGGDELGTAELYDPVSGTWIFTGSLPFPLGGPLTAERLPDGTVLLVGGGMSERYDPASGTWTFAGRVIGGSSNAISLVDGRVLVAGGWGSDDGNAVDAHAVKAASVYDPTTGTWTSAGSLNFARYWSSATRLLDGRVLVARGSDQGDLLYTLSTAEIYDPVAGTWTVVPDDTGTGAPTVFHTATLLNGGKVLFAGGYTSDEYGCCAIAVSVLFDPMTLTSTRIGYLPTPRYLHTATRLRNGDVLVAGGEAPSSWPAIQYLSFDSVEQLAAGSTTWSSAPRLNVARSGHTATLLADGRVLVVGGMQMDGGPPYTVTTLRSAEIYAPPSSDGPPCSDDKNHYILSCLLPP